MKIHMLHLGFAPARIFMTSVEQIHKTFGPLEGSKLCLWNHYPQYKHRNREVSKRVCEVFGIEWHDQGENLGLSAGYNFLIEKTQYADDDIIIACDPDVYPVTQNWGVAMAAAFKENPDLGWCTLMNEHSQREMKERGYEVREGRHALSPTLWFPKQAVINSICGFRGSALNALKGFHEPKKYYGGFEGCMFPRLLKAGFKWGFLQDFWEKHTPLVESEPIYREYKLEYGYYNRTNLSFEEYLRAKGLLHEV